ncbi:MAG: HAD-IA family hydrolase [Ignavibacteria bacterium]|nr:HAD-IA family hydrolase [Ignavibacteria bacterium]
MLNFKQFKVLSFDCYGTLIDWETGILNSLKPLLKKYRFEVEDLKLLELYGLFESDIEKEEYINYKEVLKKVVQKFANYCGFSPTPEEENCLVDSLKFWEPFPDTINSLKQLKEIYKLAVISNVDNDLFSHTSKLLEVEFDFIVTAEDVTSYKPNLKNFTHALNFMQVQPTQVLHIAQSIYHDIIPAKHLGIPTVLVRRSFGFGATPKAVGEPDLIVQNLDEFVSMVKSSLKYQ